MSIIDDYADIARRMRGDKGEFLCEVCGTDCDFALDPPEHVRCSACCDDHDYRYDEMFRQHLCHFCGMAAPDGYYFP
jgi:hypothetical protein